MSGHGDDAFSHPLGRVKRHMTVTRTGIAGGGAESLHSIDLVRPGLTFRQAEERVLGATHESFGAVLCRKWNFPMQFVHVAGFHHEPMQLPESDCVLPAIVHVADILASHTGLGYSRTVETDTIDQQILNVLGLREDDIEAIAEMLPDAPEHLAGPLWP